MVRSGDTLGAVKLLRVEEGLSLSEAKQRVEEISALPTGES
jgi:ribosomal protein L7/L12